MEGANLVKQIESLNTYIKEKDAKVKKDIEDMDKDFESKKT